MSRNPAHDHLSAFLDGELDEAEALAVESALEADPALKEELARLKGVQHLLRTHGRTRAPEGFAARVLEAAREQAPAPAPWWRRPFGVPLEGVLVAAAAALVLVIAVPRSLETEAPPPVAAAGKTEADDRNPGQAEGLVDANPDGDDAVADAAGVGLEGRGTRDGGAEIGLGGLGTTGMGVGGGGAGYGAGLGSKGGEPAPVGTNEENNAEKLALDGDPEVAPPQVGAAPPTVAPGGAGEEQPTSQFSASLYSEDEEILGALQRLAAKHGGRIRDANGKLLTLGVLEERETRLVVEVPGDELTAFNRGLEALGARLETSGDTDLASGTLVQFPLRVVWVANAPSTKGEPPPAATRHQADALESSDPK